MRVLSDLSTYTSLDPSHLADTTLHCPVCDHDHQIPFKIVKSGKNLIKTIPDVLESVLGNPPNMIGVIYDKHIELKLDSLFFDSFSNLGLSFKRLGLGQKGKLLDASVKLGNDTATNLPEDIDFLLGVGSGVISDLTKWTATKCNLPFMLMGTALSMNAYTSITGTMSENNIKTSNLLDPASVVYLDSELLASAPEEMTHAGFGDILARNVANADWKLREIIHGTYFCPVPFQMMSHSQDELIPLVKGLGNNDLEAIEILSNAVLTSGYSMTVLNGDPSPSSGSEHIISHFFDFQHEVFNLPKNLHGTQVGIANIIMSAAYEILQEVDPNDFDIDDIERRRPSQTAINLDLQRVFGDHASVFSDAVSTKRIKDVEYRQYITKIIDSWDDIWNAVNIYLMPVENIRSAMEAAGAVTKLSGVNRSSEEAIQALLYGPQYRDRYTILDLYWELGLFPTLAPAILERSGVLE